MLVKELLGVGLTRKSSKQKCYQVDTDDLMKKK